MGSKFHPSWGVEALELRAQHHPREKERGEEERRLREEVHSRRSRDRSALAEYAITAQCERASTSEVDCLRGETSARMATVVLGYWDIRGLAESIRYLLAHAGVDYEDKRYGYGDGPEPSRDEWLAEKYKLNLDFPNLPYLIDGDVRMTQTVAILRYLGRKHGVAPRDDDTQRRVDMLEQQASDVFWSATRLCYGPDYGDDKRRQFLVDVAEKLRQLEASLAKHGPFGAGKDVTYVDFLLYETLQAVKTLGPNTFRKGYCALEEYCQRIASLPGLKEYLASDRFKPWPFCSPFANALGPQHDPPVDDC